MPDLQSFIPESSESNVHVGTLPSSASSINQSNTSGTSSVRSDCSVLSHDDGRHLEIAAIESTFMVHEFDKRKQKWVERTRTVRLKRSISLILHINISVTDRGISETWPIKIHYST